MEKKIRPEDVVSFVHESLNDLERIYDYASTAGEEMLEKGNLSYAIVLKEIASTIKPLVERKEELLSKVMGF